MAQASSNIPLNGSRLTRYLTELAVTDATPSHHQFTERLGQLINFSDSITLSNAHDQLPNTPFDQRQVSSDAVKAEFLRVRASLIQTIIKSFAPTKGPATIKLPIPTADTPTTKATAYEPYQRFYAMHQRENDFKIQTLHSYVSDAVSGHSAELAQLAALDTAVNNAIAGHTRKFFASIVTLLQKRFTHLLHEHQHNQSSPPTEENPEHWTQPGGWLAKFYGEMQGLLLAELDVRLQPVLGLVEALNEQVEKTHD